MSRRERRLLRRKGKHKQTAEPVEEQKQEEHEPSHKRHQKHSGLLKWYDKNYKTNMWVMLGLLLISFIVIAGNVILTGDFIHRGISLKGGVTVTAPYEQSIDTYEIQEYLQNTVGGSINVRSLSSAGKTIGFIVDASDVDPEVLVPALEDKLGELPKISVESMGSALGESFFKQTLIAIGIAFLLMALVVFLSFRTFVPGIAVILSAVTDMSMTVAVLDIMKFKLETAGIAALLMLIGYSVDTDILLTTRVLKRQEGTVFDKCLGAMGTGLTMTLTSFAAIFVGYWFTQSETLKQIMFILLIGLLVDIPSTWIQNVGILRWYMDKKAKKGKQ